MLGRLFDKLVFGAALILSLQVPLLVDHYQQYLSGMYEATLVQVEGYQQTATENGFANARTMVSHHLQNEDASVRMDADQKLMTLDRFVELQDGMSIFEHGYLWEKLSYMASPLRVNDLKKTIKHYQLGIPMTTTGLAFGVIIALLVNFILSLPFMLWRLLDGQMA